MSAWAHRSAVAAFLRRPGDRRAGRGAGAAGCEHAGWCVARWCRGLAMLGVLAVCSGCTSLSSLSYYTQSVGGHLEVLRAARPIDDWLGDAGTPAALKARLVQVRTIREFAVRELGLPDNASYRSYADLGRPFVVWNVTAAPRFSLKLMQWCFPVAGCVDYRGYYDRAAAEEYARTLRAEGWDVQVGGVRAYSTLGWTADPVLSTFIDLPEVEIARLIFHELSHQLLYVPGDSTFNESFATAFEEEGVRRWLKQRADPAMDAAWRRYRQRRTAFLELVQEARQHLAALYASNLPAERMAEGKAGIMRKLRADHAAARADPGSGLYGFTGYDRFFQGDLNNAALAALATYTQMQPAFAKLLQDRNFDLGEFVRLARGLAGLPHAERRQRLAAWVRESSDAAAAN